MKVYSKNRGCEVIPDKNGVSLESLRNENLSLNDDDGDDHSHNELLVVDDEKMMKNLIMFLMSQTLFKLREKFNVTTKATRFVNEKFLNIRTDQKERSDVIHKSLKKNYRHPLIILNSLSCYNMLRG